MATPSRFMILTAVHLLLIKDKKVLLARRFQTGYKDGWYAFPGGHLEPDEPTGQAMIREAQEEVGVKIQPADLHFGHVMHRRSSNRDYIDFFFVCKKWQGVPKIAEPDKCDDMAWFDFEALPENTIDYVIEVVRNYQAGTFYSEMGWKP